VRVAISNIAWPSYADAEVAALLERLGVRGIEVAPTKIWPTPTSAPRAEVAAYRRWWAERGFLIVGGQALLFGRPDLSIFESAQIRQKTLAYLVQVVQLCADLGAGPLVFGSPRNRRRGAVPLHEAEQIAVDFFSALAEAALPTGATVVLEANPPAYGADFVTSAREAIAMVRRVAHQAFRLHLDTACIVMADDNVSDVVAEGRDILEHVHASEPQLAAIGTGGVDHAAFAHALREERYDGWVSVEMREPSPFRLDYLEAAMTRALAVYGDPDSPTVGPASEPRLRGDDNQLEAGSSMRPPSPLR